MTSRKEDELDLMAMEIADSVEKSDSLRLISDPKPVLIELAELMEKAGTRQGTVS